MSFSVAFLSHFQAKGKMGGLTVTLAYVFMFSTVKSFPYLLSALSMDIMLYLFAASCLAFCIFIYNFLPETYGKSLIDIENYFIKP
jgi:facilitated trehalose transporter